MDEMGHGSWVGPGEQPNHSHIGSGRFGCESIIRFSISLLHNFLLQFFFINFFWYKIIKKNGWFDSSQWDKKEEIVWRVNKNNKTTNKQTNKQARKPTSTSTSTPTKQ